MLQNPFQGAGVQGRQSEANQRRRNPREKGTRPQGATQGLRHSFHSGGSSQAALRGETRGGKAGLGVQEGSERKLPRRVK